MSVILLQVMIPYPMMNGFVHSPFADLLSNLHPVKQWCPFPASFRASLYGMSSIIFRVKSFLSTLNVCSSFLSSFFPHRFFRCPQASFLVPPYDTSHSPISLIRIGLDYYSSWMIIIARLLSNLELDWRTFVSQDASRAAVRRKCVVSSAIMICIKYPWEPS